MGNPMTVGTQSRVRKFYRSSSWIEGAAEKQLGDVASLSAVASVSAFPDLHPGKFGPVGIAVDVEGMIYPNLIGTDIGCGVSLFSTEIEERKLRVDRLAERLPDLLETGGSETSHGFSAGSIGFGNHFAEATVVRSILDSDLAAGAGIQRGAVQILVHSGSRAFGASIFDWYQTSYRNSPLQGVDAEQYLERHDAAMEFARTNRRLVSENFANAMRSEIVLVSDVPHNFVERRGSTMRHRKGASTTQNGLCVVLGSRGALSYVVAPAELADEDAMASIAHGAGRKLDRATARARFGGKGVLDRSYKNPFGGRIICRDKALAAEEDAGAYKSIEQVIDDLVAFGLIKVVATLQPMLTYKTAGGA